MTPRLKTWIFAASWAWRMYQVCDGGVWIWVMVGWIGVWMLRKWMRRT